MKTVICALHSQYIHSALAPWYLKAAAEAWCRLPQEITVWEGTVNQSDEAVLSALIGQKADVLAFSCYIWNGAMARRLLPLLAQQAPDTVLILGGPEAGFRAEELMEALPMVFAVQTGEGERSFSLLLDRLAAGEEPADVPGLWYRNETGGLVHHPAEPLGEDPPSPYTQEYLSALKGRIAYLETSRGCPFSCAFCLSGRRDGVRFFDLERAKRELLLLANSGARTIKLVDRTFNCTPDRARALIAFVMEQVGTTIPKGVCFHLEVAADLFDDETIDLLRQAPAGLFQLEAGLQSFHLPTLEAVTRKTDLNRLCGNLTRLLEKGNVHIHIDLIAGLPQEDLDIFSGSFNRAYRLAPQLLQLGFLKLLPGSRLAAQADELGYVYDRVPPYEFRCCPWMGEEEKARLHRLEDVLERLYNSGRFRWTLAYVLKAAGLEPFAFFDGMAEALHRQGLETAGVSLDTYAALTYAHCAGLSGVEKARLRDVMTCDLLVSSRNGRLPPCLQVKDKRLGRIKRELAAAAPKGARRGVAILYSFGGRAVAADYEEPPDPVTNRYALRWAAPAPGGDAAAADPPG